MRKQVSLVPRRTGYRRCYSNAVSSAYRPTRDLLKGNWFVPDCRCRLEFFFSCRESKSGRPRIMGNRRWRSRVNSSRRRIVAGLPGGELHFVCDPLPCPERQARKIPGSAFIVNYRCFTRFVLLRRSRAMFCATGCIQRLLHRCGSARQLARVCRQQPVPWTWFDVEASGTPDGGGADGIGRSPGLRPPGARRTRWWCRGACSHGCRCCSGRV